MNKKETDFRKRLIATFKIEAQEHLNTMSRELVLLEKMPISDAQAGLLESIYRESHSLKGASRAVNMMGIEAVCQSLEAVFAAWQQKRIAPSQGLFDAGYHALDIIRKYLLSLEQGNVPEKSHVFKVIEELSRIEAGGEQEGRGAEEKRSYISLAPPLPCTHAPCSTAPCIRYRKDIHCKAGVAAVRGRGDAFCEADRKAVCYKP